jgi:hypothetical protein
MDLGGLEYLLGVVYREDGEIVYRAFWATNGGAERGGRFASIWAGLLRLSGFWYFWPESSSSGLRCLMFFVGRPIVLLAMIAVSLSACGGGGGAARRTAQATLDDVLRGIRQASLDDVTRGAAGDVDDAFRANSSAVDDAFRVGAFRTAVSEAARVADVEVQSQVDRWFDGFDDFIKRRVERKIKIMICEARLYAQNQEGDIELFAPWIMHEFESIDVLLTDSGVAEVGEFLAEKVNDKSSTYSLACFAWVQFARSS